MKLLRLKITDPKGFRSLQSGFEHHFRTEWDMQEEEQGFAPFVCAGPNGSGKSNLLEALAAIFFHIDCQHMEKLPENFEYASGDQKGFRPERSDPDGFELEYLISVKNKDGFNWGDNSKLARVLIEKASKEAPKVSLLNPELLEDAFDAEKLPRHMVKKLLPDFVVGYSSGENEILSIPFLKMRFLNYDEYRYYVQNDDHYGVAPEGRMFFLDDHLNQIILLSNLLFKNNSSLSVFDELAGIKSVKQFRLLIVKWHPKSRQVAKVQKLPI